MEQTNWSVTSDAPSRGNSRSNQYMNLINPVEVRRGSPPIRSRNQSSNSNLNNRSYAPSASPRSRSRMSNDYSLQESRPDMSSNSVDQGLSRVPISQIISDGNKSLINNDDLLNQKEHMHNNNLELAKYIEYKKDLENKIKELQNKNYDLRKLRENGVAPKPDYKPRDHFKQKIVAKLHADIYDAQNEYDKKMEEINEISYKTKSLQDEINHKIGQAEDLQRTREDQNKKTLQAKLQLAPLEDQRETLQKQIADNEEDFQDAYTHLLNQLAEKKPMDIPEMASKPDPEMQAIHLNHLKDQMRRIRQDIQNANNNQERNRELYRLRKEKEDLEKANDSMQKQTNMLEKKINAISEEALEARRQKAAEEAKLNALRDAYEQEVRDHSEKMRKLHHQYKTLYDNYQDITNSIKDQREKANRHKSIQEELKEMRRLLKMTSISGSPLRTPSPSSVKEPTPIVTPRTPSPAKIKDVIVTKPEQTSHYEADSKRSSITNKTNDKGEELVEIDFRKMGGTIYPSKQYNIKTDVQKLHKAMAGLGTDEKTIINILGNRPLKHRREIIRTYNYMYEKEKKNFSNKLYSETSGFFREALMSLLQSFGELDATSVNKALKKNDLDMLIMTLGTRTTKQTEEMKERYFKKYNDSFLNDLRRNYNNEEDQSFVNFIGALTEAPLRTIANSHIIKSAAIEDFNYLKSFDIKIWDQAHVMKDIMPILTSRPYEHVYYITNILWNERYPNMDIVQQVGAALPNSNYKKALITYLELITVLPAQCFADRFYKAISKKDRDPLTYFTIARSELDTTDIKQCFRQRYNTTIDEFIKKKLGKGDYEKLMQEILTLDPNLHEGNVVMEK